MKEKLVVFIIKGKPLVDCGKKCNIPFVDELWFLTKEDYER